MLRGAGIQQNHANFTIDDKGYISLNISGEEAYDQTLVNGKPLEKKEGNNFKVELNHQDRICIGANTMFLFRYPLQKFKKDKVLKELVEQNPEMDPDEIEQKVEEKLHEEGLTTDVNNLICQEYTDDFIKEDDETATECFEWAIREAQEAEEQKTKA